MRVPASRVRYVAAFAGIYIIWGSTYLAIRYAVETFPPLLMASARFILGGTLFFLWANFRSSPTVTVSQLRWSIVAGVLMLGVGGGAVHWAEQYVPSGLTALLVASVPLMMVLLDWLRPSGRRPSGLALAGVIAGFIGIGFLVQPESDIAHQAEYLTGSIAVLVGCLAWSFGSVLSRYVDMPESKSLETSIKLYAGGLAVLIAGLISGEPQQIVWSQVSLRSVLALAYLVVLGSSAFVGYNYLLKVTNTAKVATYAYINPVVAVILGVFLADETFSTTTAVVMAIVVTAVIVIVSESGQRSSKQRVRANRDELPDAEARQAKMGQAEGRRF